jgi:HEAT repeat protein
MTHVFVSYVRENSDVVDRLVTELKKHGATVWLDRSDIGVGSRWKAEIKKAIKSGNFFLACFSKEYDERQKTYMNEELIQAIDMLREMPAHRTWFIPVLINGGQIPDRRISSVEDLNDLNAVDLSSDWNGGIENILRTIGHSDPKLGRALSVANVAKNFGATESLQAIERLGKLGIADRRVLAVLIDATTSKSDHYTKHAAVLALAEIGAATVPALAAALPTAEEVSRKCILHALQRIGPDAGAAVPAIVTVLQERHSIVERPGVWFDNVPERAIRTLGAIGSAAEDAVPCLGARLQGASRKLRSLAAFALTHIGPRSMPPLARALKDPKLRKDVAAGILWAAVTGSSEQASKVFAHVGPSVAVPGLLAALEGENKTTRNVSTAAIDALGQIGPDAARALPVLVALSKDDHTDGRHIERALARIGSLRNGKWYPRRARRPRRPTAGRRSKQASASARKS